MSPNTIIFTRAPRAPGGRLIIERVQENADARLILAALRYLDDPRGIRAWRLAGPAWGRPGMWVLVEQPSDIECEVVFAREDELKKAGVTAAQLGRAFIASAQGLKTIKSRPFEARKQGRAA